MAAAASSAGILATMGRLSSSHGHVMVLVAVLGAVVASASAIDISHLEGHRQYTKRSGEFFVYFFLSLFGVLRPRAWFSVLEEWSPVLKGWSPPFSVLKEWSPVLRSRLGPSRPNPSISRTPPFLSPASLPLFLPLRRPAPRGASVPSLLPFAQSIRGAERESAV